MCRGKDKRTTFCSTIYLALNSLAPKHVKPAGTGFTVYWRRADNPDFFGARSTDVLTMEAKVAGLHGPVNSCFKLLLLMAGLRILKYLSYA